MKEWLPVRDRFDGNMMFNPWKSMRVEALYTAYVWAMKVLLSVRHPELSKKKAIRVMDQDWDYLIILDACRYDLYKRVVDQNADFVISGASATQEWVKWNFNGEFKDVIYVAGNPHLASANLVKTFGFNPFFKVIEVWDFGWNSNLKTVPPEEVTLAALQTLKKFPNKRMVIHYNQPHHPFLSDRDLVRSYDGTWNKLEDGIWGGRCTTIWDALRLGEVSIERVWKGYEENLKLVMDEVSTLVNDLQGRVIITSDHGNQIGEYLLFGHARGLRTKESVRVPWVVVKDVAREIGPRMDLQKKEDQLRIETELIKERVRKLKRSGKV